MNILQFGLVVQENRGVCVCGGGTKKGEGLHVLKSRRLTSLIGVRLLPPSAIKARRRHRSHDLLDSRHLSLWCGVIKGSRGFSGGIIGYLRVEPSCVCTMSFWPCGCLSFAQTNEFLSAPKQKCPAANHSVGTNNLSLGAMD